MPKVTKNTNRKTNTTKMICQNPNCEKEGREQSSGNFYNTNSSILPKYPVCKNCLQKIIDTENMNTVFKILKEMDIAFIKSFWDSNCDKNPENPFGTYIRQMNSLPQYRGMRWSDEDPKDIFPTVASNFNVTSEMIERWGSKHDKEDYIKLENFYNDMKVSNSIETAQDVAYLKKLAVISLRLDKQLENGNYGEVKQLGDLFSKFMGDSKFRAMDKTDADRNGGIRNFSSIYAEVEKDGFIPPWSHYQKIKGVSQDIVDKTIMHIENFTLKLNRVERMTSPPKDTPKLKKEEIDYESIEVINDIEVDVMNDDILGDD